MTNTIFLVGRSRMNNIKIERIEKKDISQIVDIWYDASLQAHDFIPEDYWRENKDQMRDIYIPMSETYKAVDGEKILGFVSLLDDYLAAIFVMQDLQGQGIGSLLLNYAMRLRKTLQLKVYRNNKKSVDFYKSKGFSVISETMDHETGERELVMQWHK